MAVNFSSANLEEFKPICTLKRHLFKVVFTILDGQMILGNKLRIKGSNSLPTTELNPRRILENVKQYLHT